MKRPPCEFDNHDMDEAPPAVAVVSQTSPGMPSPYAWVSSCGACLAEWRRNSEGETFLRLVPFDGVL